MNRLTRCPACTTVFRVSDEQLDSRQGFVRCGQCAKVFDARASLMEERASGATPGEPTTDTAGDESVQAPVQAEVEAPAESAGRATAAPADPTDASPDEADPFEGMDVEEIVLSLDEADPDEPPMHETPSASADSESAPAVDDAAPDATAAPAAAPDVAPVRPAVVRPMAAHDDEPLPFGPKHRARSRAATMAWGAGALLLVLVLAAQSAYWFRAEIATAVPDARPYLELGCRQLKCAVPPPRQTALLSIESSELQVDKNVPGLLTLNATLRNRAAFAQAHPSIELTLTDADDRPMSRRVLAPADYLADRLAKEPLFPAVSEHTVRIHIDATAFKPTGYRLFLFHP